MPPANTSRNYKYTLLKDVKENSIVNVYGVVRYFKTPTKSRGQDFYTMITIVDDSIDEEQRKLKCMIFAPSASACPEVQNENIVRMHRLKISFYSSALQGSSGPGFSCLVFSSDPDGPVEPISTSRNYTLTSEDEARVCALRRWLHRDPQARSMLTESTPCRSHCLSELQPKVFFNLDCQVVSICVLAEGTACLLRVWDGTKPVLPLYEEDTRTEELSTRIKTAKTLYRKALGYMADVFVYDSHYTEACKISPGDFVKFVNLHAAEHKEPDVQPVVPLTELTLHDGGQMFGRCLRKLDPDCQELRTLKLLMEEAAESQDSEDDSLDFELKEQPPQSRPVADDPTEPSSSSGELARCMQRSATILTANQHIKPISLAEVLCQSPPRKFRVCVRVMDYNMRTTNLLDFLRLSCLVCDHTCAIPGSSDASSASKSTLQRCFEENGVDVYRCPECDTRKVLSVLQYIYMLQLSLHDGSESILATLWRQDAVTFFHGIPPMELMRDPALYQELYDQLQQLCPKEDDLQNVQWDRHPWAECCIKAYTTSRGTSYQVFDTTLCAPDLM